MNLRTFYEIGWDFACHGIHPPEDSNEQIRKAVMHGYAEAIHRRGKFPPNYDIFLRKWLLLRLGAARRDRAVDLKVTPDYLRSLFRPMCPVRHVLFTAGTGGPNDWSIDRLCNDGAYCPGNLVFMSTKANKAKGGLLLDHVIKIIESDAPVHAELTRIEWVRMLALMRPAFEKAGLFPYRMLLPLVQYPGPDQALFPEDALQLAIILDLKGKRKLVGKLRDKCPNPEAAKALHRLVMKAKRRLPKMASEHVFSDVATFRCLLELDSHVTFSWWVDTSRWIFIELGAFKLGDTVDNSAFKLETRGYVFT